MKRKQHTPTDRNYRKDTAMIYESKPGALIKLRKGRRYRWEKNGQLTRLEDV